MFKKTVAVALTALSLCAGTAFASKSDDRYDRYNPGAAVEESSRSYKEANAYTAVLIGSKDEYLNRQGLFFEIIKDEMNEDRQYGTPEIVCDSDLQAKWIEYCNSTMHTGEHILQPDLLAEFAAQQAQPVLFVYATEDINDSQKRVYDDGRFKTKYVVSQRFVVVLADKNGISRRYEFTAEGDSSRSRDRALVDAFEEGVEQGAHLLFRAR